MGQGDGAADVEEAEDAIEEEVLHDCTFRVVSAGTAHLSACTAVHRDTSSVLVLSYSACLSQLSQSMDQTSSRRYSENTIKYYTNCLSRRTRLPLGKCA